jgi:proline iminopeptidase
VPTLAIGAAHDTMDPARMRALALPMPRGQYLHCPNGSLATLYGDPMTGIAVLMECLRAVHSAAAG